jgi:D-aminoacyl-tRNA deacylase
MTPKTVLICSLNDAAGTNIRERLFDLHGYSEFRNEFFDGSPVHTLTPPSDNILLVSSQKDIVYVEGLDERFGKDDPDSTRYVFISRHRAESGIPSLTAHFTGNLGPTADFGGRPEEVARHSPALLKNYLLALNSHHSEIPQQYNITLEATHHGPTDLGSSVLFVELGSTEDQWRDVDTARVIAKSLLEALTSKKTFSKCGIGIGGTHYPEKLNNMILETETALSVIIPKYALEYLDSKLLDQIMQKSDQEVTAALLDPKGLGKYKENVLRLIRESGLEEINL